MNKHVFVFAILASVGLLAQGAPQHRFWPIVIAYGNTFEDVPKLTADDAASGATNVEPVVAAEEVVTEAVVPIDHMDESFTLAPEVLEEVVPAETVVEEVVPVPAEEVSEVVPQEVPVQPEEQPQPVDVREVWERAARNLALRPDLLAWLASLTPEMMAPKTPAPEVQQPEVVAQEAAVIEQEPEVIQAPIEEVVPVQEVAEPVREEIVVEEEPEIITEMTPVLIEEEQPVIAVEEVVAAKPEVVTEMMPEVEIVTDIPEMEMKPALIPQPVNSIVVEDTVKPEPKKSFNKVKLNRFKEEQSSKKGKTLFSGAPDVFLQNFPVDAFPTFSYSVRHVPAHSAWGR